MAKLKELKIEITGEVSPTFKDGRLGVAGPLGEMSLTIPRDLPLSLNGQSLLLKRGGADKKIFGLYVVLLKNLIEGVARGFRKELDLVGIGFKAKKEGRNLVLSIGFSHPVSFTPPVGCEIEVKNETHLSVVGVDKQVVGQVAAGLKALKKPEPYKGKGIRYSGEAVRRKAGKAAKAGPASK